MPVRFKGPSGKVSVQVKSWDASLQGNTLNTLVDESRISHRLTAKGVPRLVLRPIMDTISITKHAEAAWSVLPAPPKSDYVPHMSMDRLAWWAQTKGRFKELCDDKSFVKLASSKRRISDYYMMDAVLDGCTPSPLLGFSKTLSAKRAPFRLELHPSKMSIDHLVALEKLWADVAGPDIPMAALFPDARLTRLDYAVDLINVRAANI